MIKITASSKAISIEGEGLNMFAMNSPITVQDVGGKVMISLPKFTQTFPHFRLEVNGKECKSTQDAISRLKKGLTGGFSIL